MHQVQLASFNLAIYTNSPNHQIKTSPKFPAIIYHIMYVCNIATGFVMILSSLNKTVEQGEAVFRCQHRSSDAIIWTVNGTSISSHNISTLSVPVGDGPTFCIFSLHCNSPWLQ